MNDEDTPLPQVNRILVALDTSARGQAALQAALHLALNTSAEIQGLFVEDEDLVRLAALPFACEVDVSSGSPRDLRLAMMESDLRASAHNAQQAFANALKEVNLQWTFRVERGTLMNASLAAAGDVDLVVIGQRARSSKTMAGGYVPEHVRADERIVAVFDGSPTGEHAVELANSLARAYESDLSVLALAAEGSEVARRCLSYLRHHEIRAEVYQVLNTSKDSVVDFVRKWPPSLLVVNRGSASIDDDQIRRLVHQFDCPLILC